MDFKQELQSIRLAISFLTLLPIAPQEQLPSELVGRSQKYFALGGLIFGLVNITILFLMMPLGKPWIMALTMVLANLFLSGGLHMDALMDSFDAIAASKKTREEIVQVLTDSRVGAFGAMAGIVVIVSKIVALANINYTGNLHLIAFMLLLTPALTRMMFVIIMATQIRSNDPMNSTGKVGSIFKDNQKPVLDIVVNIATVKIAALIFLAFHWIRFGKLLLCDLIFVAWLVAMFYAYAWLKHKLKGHNGDSLGAGSEAGEAIIFFVLALVF